MQQLLTKRIVQFLFAAMLVAGGLFVPLSPAHAADAETGSSEIVIEIAIPVPGTTFNCAQENHKGKLCVSSFGDYIGGVYRFFAAAIGIIAAAIVLWGGIKWMTAAGNAAKVKEGRDAIYAALTALLLVFGSYVILYTINPQLVKLKLPTIDSIVGVQQAAYYCSDAPFDDIDFSACNPLNGSTECCGQRLKVNLGGGKTSDCIWDSCNGLDQVCITYDDAGSLLPTYQCISASNYCKSTKGDKRAWCTKADSVVRTSKMRTGEKKFQYTGCGFGDIPVLADTCTWGITFDQYFKLYSPPAGYQDQFVDCFTENAKGVCWDDVGGAKQALQCEIGSRQVCKGPGDSPRGIIGVDGGCLVKSGPLSGTSADYRCFDTPSSDPLLNGPWGTSPNISY